MATLGIRVLGTGLIGRGDVGALAMPDIWWPVLGCLLAAPGRRTSRGRLAAQIWPEKDEAAARHCLATALWRIKARLPAGLELLRVAGDRIALALDRRVWIDALVFERRAAEALADPARLADRTARLRLARALALYRGELLGECEQEWVALERERLRALHLDALFELATAEARAGDWPAARASGQTLCLAEPLREDAQRLLITATAECGNRALAIQLYRGYARLLAAELDVTPMAETTALVARISGMPPPPPAKRAPGDYRGALLRTRDEIARTLSMLELTLAE